MNASLRFVVRSSIPYLPIMGTSHLPRAMGYDRRIQSAQDGDLLLRRPRPKRIIERFFAKFGRALGVGFNQRALTPEPRLSMDQGGAFKKGSLRCTLRHVFISPDREIAPTNISRPYLEAEFRRMAHWCRENRLLRLRVTIEIEELGMVCSRSWIHRKISPLKGRQAVPVSRTERVAEGERVLRQMERANQDSFAFLHALGGFLKAENPDFEEVELQVHLRPFSPLHRTLRTLQRRILQQKFAGHFRFSHQAKMGASSWIRGWFSWCLGKIGDALFKELIQKIWYILFGIVSGSIGSCIVQKPQSNVDPKPNTVIVVVDESPVAIAR